MRISVYPRRRILQKNRIVIVSVWQLLRAAAAATTTTVTAVADTVGCLIPRLSENDAARSTVVFPGTIPQAAQNMTAAVNHLVIQSCIS